MGVLITFMYLFAFPLSKIPVIDSSWIAILVLMLYLFFNRKYKAYAYRMVCQKKVYNTLAMIVFICLYCGIVTTLHGVYDYSFITTMLHQAVSLIFGLFVIAYLKTKEKNILETIIYAFVAQGVLQMISMFIPKFRDATNIFRPESAIYIGQWSYTGIRGLAISGSAFFGLAVAYGMIDILWALYHDKLFTEKTPLSKMVMLAILIFGGFSAGRTSFIGFIIAAAIYMIKNKNYKKYITPQKIISFIGAVIGIIIVLLIIKKSGVLGADQTRYLTNYIMEFTKTGTTTSSTELFDEMYFGIDFYTFFMGDGHYLSDGGSYYMNTDAGYMRVILYVGVLGLVLLMLLQSMYLYKGCGSSRFNRIVIIAFLMVMQIKGEVIGFLIIVEAILLLFYYYEYDMRSTCT